MTSSSSSSPAADAPASATAAGEVAGPPIDHSDPPLNESSPPAADPTTTTTITTSASCTMEMGDDTGNAGAPIPAQPGDADEDGSAASNTATTHPRNEATGNQGGGMAMYDQPPQQQHSMRGAGNVSYLPPQVYSYGPPPPLPPHMMYPYGPPPPHPRMPPGPPPLQMMHMYCHPPPPDAMRPIMYPPPHLHHHYAYTPQMMMHHYPPHPLQPPQLVPSMMMGHPPHTGGGIGSTKSDSIIGDEGTDKDDAKVGNYNDTAGTVTTWPEKSPSSSQSGDEDCPNQRGPKQQQQREEDDDDDEDDDDKVDKGANDAAPQHEVGDNNIKIEEAAAAGDEVEEQAAILPQDPDTTSNPKRDPPSITKLLTQRQDESNMTPTTCNTTLSQISPQGLDSVPHHAHPTGGGSNNAPNCSNNNNNTTLLLGSSSGGGMRMMLYPTGGTTQTSLTTATPLYHHTSSNPPPANLSSSSSMIDINTPQASLHLLSSPYDFSHGSFSAITTNSHFQRQQQQQYFPMPVSSSALSGGGGGENRYHQHPPYNSNNDHRMHPPNKRMPLPPSSSFRPPPPQQHQQYVYQYQHFDPRSHEDDVVEKGNLPSTTNSTTMNTKEMTNPSTKSTTNHLDGSNTNQQHHAHPSHHHYHGGVRGNSVIPPTVHMPNFLGGYTNKDVSPLTTSHFSAIKNAAAAAAGGGGPASTSAGGAAMYMFGNHHTSSRFLESSPDGSMPDFGNNSPIILASDDMTGGGNAAEFQSSLSPSGDGTAPTANTYVKASPLDLLSSVSTSPVMAHHHPGERTLSSHNMMLSQQQQQQQHHPQHSHLTYSYPPPPQYHQSYYHQKGASPYGVHHQEEGQDNTYSPTLLAPATSTTTDSTTTPMKSKQSNFELMLSAANTLDIDESSTKATANHHHAKKRKLSSENAKTIKKRLLVNTSNLESMAASTSATASSCNLFSVGGYPPGFDLSTLPPTRLNHKSVNNNSKVTNSNVTKCIDSESVAQAQQALLLATQALERPRVGKQLLLSMALVRANPRTPPSCYPAHGTVLTDRFHWAAYPPLDMILRKNMKRYYELSTNRCQSRDQQVFNNELVSSVKSEAQKYGWEFDDKAFDDKKIRDRIRCFYKTHIQNAKKRLKTMLRHPEKRANIRALAAHFHLIEEKGFESGDPANTTAMTASTTDDEDCDDYVDADANEQDSLGFGLSQSYSTENEQLPLYHQKHQQQPMHKDEGGQKYDRE